MLFLLEIPPTLFGLHLEKMPAYSSASGEDKFSVRAVFPPLDIPSVYPKSRKSLFIKKCFFFPVLDVLLSSSRPSLETWGGRRGGWGVVGYLRSLRPFLLKAPFLIDCVFDPETGWQLSLTAAWLNAKILPPPVENRKNLWHQHGLFHWHEYSLAEL